MKNIVKEVLLYTTRMSALYRFDEALPHTHFYTKSTHLVSLQPSFIYFIYTLGPQTVINMWFRKLFYCKYFIFNYIESKLCTQEQIVLIVTRKKQQLDDGIPWVLCAGDPECYNIVHLQLIFFIFSSICCVLSM